MHTFRNPADLLGLGKDPAVIRLLRACGCDEAYVTGSASDYDKFMTLAAAMPLCAGHPLEGEVNTGLATATGYAAPLCPHTAKTHWDKWVETHLYGKGATAPAPAVDCPLCAPAAPAVWREDDLTRLPDPLTITAPDLASWSRTLEGCLSHAAPALLALPHGYTFARPNPYHAGLAVGKVSRGEELTRSEEDLLITQALRVWGIALSKRETGDTPALFLRGGEPAAVISLLAYLDASGALPHLVWIPHDPAFAGEVSGLYSRVGTGYAVKEADTPEAIEEKKRSYAAVAPVGRAVVLTEG